MPHAKADWATAQLLHSQGLKYPIIAERIGVKTATIRQYAKRHRWGHQLQEARQAVTQAVQSMVMRDPETIQERAQKWVQRECTRVERVTDVLDSVPIPTEIKGLREHIEVAAMNGKYGRSTFGLDQAQGQVHISIGMFGKEQVEPTSGQVIDVEPVPQLPQDTPPT